MTLEDYKKALSEIKDRHEKELKQFYKYVALQNAKYKEGDIIEDHFGKGKVIKIYNITRFLGDDMPSVNYLCENYNKSGSISKREPTRVIYSNNII